MDRPATARNSPDSAQFPSAMIDFSRDLKLVQRLALAHSIRESLRGPASLAAGALASGPARGIATVLAGSDGAEWRLLNLVWKQRYGLSPGRWMSPMVRSLWEGSKVPLGSLEAHSSTYEYRSVFGIPIGCQPTHDRGWSHCPATEAQIFDRARGRDWLFSTDDFGRSKMTPDAGIPDGAIVDHRTRALIEDIESIPGCRAHVLWGPPGGGKSIAARQIARAVGGSWARIAGTACTSADVWAALAALRPRALIVDDIDVGAGEESALMAGLEDARGWGARTIISTANVVPSSNGSDRTVRGAVIRRASDGALVEYRTLSPEVRRAIAPDVPDGLGAEDLLARYQAELQRRAVARGVTQADVEELLALQGLVGDR